MQPFSDVYEYLICPESNLSQLRIAEPEAEGQPREVEGLAVPYNALSHDLGGFVERVLPGAFDAALESSEDMRVDVEHDPRLILARRSKGTARFWSTDGGLMVRFQIPDTYRGRDVAEDIRQGNLDALSAAWLRDGTQDRFVREEGRLVREIVQAPLRGVTLTFRPAYRQTAGTLVLRSLEAFLEAEGEQGAGDGREGAGDRGQGTGDATAEAEEVAQRRRRLELEEELNRPLKAGG